MKIIKPLAVTDAMLSSHSVAENDHLPWSSGTTYAVDDYCIRAETHRVYRSLIASNLNNIPENNLTGSTPAWLDVGPTNRWAMFDNVVGTKTTAATSISVVLLPGQIGGLALMELAGKTLEVSMKDAPGGTVVYSKTISLDGTLIGRLFDWFYQPWQQLTDVVLTDLPYQYFNPELTITLSATSGNVSCGVCKFGEVQSIGATEYGATAGIIDYSRKEKDAFGNLILVERSFAKNNSYKIELDHASFNRVHRQLSALRAQLCIYVGTEVAGYEPLMVYGFFRDFEIDVSYLTLHYCSLKVEGLI